MLLACNAVPYNGFAPYCQQKTKAVSFLRSISKLSRGHSFCGVRLFSDDFSYQGLFRRCRPEDARFAFQLPAKALLSLTVFPSGAKILGRN